MDHMICSIFYGVYFYLNDMIILFFSLPIATPPNAIAFSYGYLETVDMIKVGTLLNILCVLVTAMLLPIVAFPAYSLGEFPAWAVMSADGAGDVLVNATMTTLGNISLAFALSILATAAVEKIFKNWQICISLISDVVAST